MTKLIELKAKLAIWERDRAKAAADLESFDASVGRCENDIAVEERRIVGAHRPAYQAWQIETEDAPVLTLGDAWDAAIRYALSLTQAELHAEVHATVENIERVCSTNVSDTESSVGYKGSIKDPVNVLTPKTDRLPRVDKNGNFGCTYAPLLNPDAAAPPAIKHQPSPPALVMEYFRHKETYGVVTVTAAGINLVAIKPVGLRDWPVEASLTINGSDFERYYESIGFLAVPPVHTPGAFSCMPMVGQHYAAKNGSSLYTMSAYHLDTFEAIPTGTVTLDGFANTVTPGFTTSLEDFVNNYWRVL